MRIVNCETGEEVASPEVYSGVYLDFIEMNCFSHSLDESVDDIRFDYRRETYRVALAHLEAIGWAKRVDPKTLKWAGPGTGCYLEEGKRGKLLGVPYRLLVELV
jgi:hypothetical protein